MYRRVSILLCCSMLAACASVVRSPVPEADHLAVTLLGRSDLRRWGDGVPESDLPFFQNVESIEKNYAGVAHREHHYLVISGGGAKGAYGAGVLNAWSDLGTRPEFTVVTGVSTGALSAPFAFLGSDYDGTLKQFYTTLDPRQIFKKRSIFSIIGGDSIVDSSPLSHLIDKFIDDEVIEALAREHARGRALLIGTTNLDAGRSVVWNITRIAASDHPGAGDLLRQVVLASASIPGAFPPVYIKVQTPDGREYDEMHVDGGITSQMFFYPAGVDWGKLTELLDVRGTPQIHLIRNAYFRPQYEAVKPRLFPITGHTINSLVRTQGIGDLFRIWALAERDGLNLNLTWIPEGAREEVGVTPDEIFDPDLMKALFDFGYRRTLVGETWVDFEKVLQEQNLNPD